MAEPHHNGGSATVLLCKSCGVGKRTPGKGAKCGACYHATRQAKRKAIKVVVEAGDYRPGSYHREATCEGCARIFPVFRPAYHRFCSRRCAGVDVLLPEQRTEKRREHRRKRKRRRAASKQAERATSPKTCPACAATFISKSKAQIYCAAACKDSRDRSPRPCKECGVEFAPEYGNKRRIFCSEGCGRRFSRRGRPDHGKNHRQRARHHGVEYEAVDRLKVFERDRWRCQVCGEKTPKRLLGGRKHRSPELDHRVPMAMGGGHTWANVQCACRECNSRKGGTLVRRQMPLFERPMISVG